MNIRGIDGSTPLQPAAPGIALQPKASAKASGVTPADTIRSLASEFANADVERLLQILNPARSATSAQEIEVVLRTLADLALQRDVGEVRPLVQRLAQVDPLQAEELPGHPDLSAIRPEIEQAIKELTSVARLNAEQELARAYQQRRNPAAGLPGWDVSAGTLLNVAEQIFSTGGLSNYEKTIRLALVVQQAGLLPVFEMPTRVPCGASSSSLKWRIPGYLTAFSRDPRSWLLLAALLLIVVFEMFLLR